MRWKLLPGNEAATARLSQQLGLSRVAAGVLAQRGISRPEEARAFLSPRLAALEDPFALTHMRQAVARLRLAMHRGEKVLVFGDYDVDGITSTTLLILVLGQFGFSPRYVVPRRLEEGYGLTLPALERALSVEKPDLLIALDCGTSAHREVAWLRQQGIDVIIVDHHRSKEALPEDCLLVNPHVFDDPAAPWSQLCTVGLVFKLLHALLKDLRAQHDPLAMEIQLREYLDLVALGTIADLVPLLGENRIFAYHGLRLLQRTQRPGLCALYEVGGMKLGEAVKPMDVAFRIGPRLNASGRLDDASRPIELLLGGDASTCRETARLLDDLNRERQEIEQRVADEATAQVESHYGEAAGLILFSPEWHAGVVGIVASRIVQKYHRPTLVMGADGPLAKGSGRSIPGVNLVEALQQCAELLERWGGHPMAVGLSVVQDRLDHLREAFASAVSAQASAEARTRSLSLSTWVDRTELNQQLLDELELLEPFGQGNPEPVLGLPATRLQQCRPLGRGHLRFCLAESAGSELSGVYWGGAATPPPENTPLDLAVRFRWNSWNGRRSPQLTLVDWRPAET